MTDKTRTYKKVVTEADNVSDRIISYDLYENDVYVTTTDSAETAWDWAGV